MDVSDKEILQVTTRQELRAWLQEHYLKEKAIWVKYSIKPEVGKILYLDLVEEALCFGWIDGITKRYQDNLIRRISRRTANSHWSELNKARVKRLDSLGLVTKEGIDAMPKEKFKIDPQIIDAINRDPDIKKNYENFPELYKIIRLDSIQDALQSHQENTYQKRLDKFLTYTKFNLMFGDWNDNGRLLDYK